MLRAQSAAVLGKQAAEAAATQESLGHTNSLTPNASLTSSPAPTSGSVTTGSNRAVHTKSGYFEDGQYYLKGNPLETQQEIICVRCGLQRIMSHTEVIDQNKKYCKRLPFYNQPGLDIYGRPFILEAGGSNRNGKDKDVAATRTLADQASTPGESPATTPPEATALKTTTTTTTTTATTKKTPLPLLTCRQCNRNIACNRMANHLKSCLNIGGRRRGGRDASQGASQNAYTTPCGSKTGTPMPEPRKNATMSPGKRARDDDDSDDESKKKIKKPTQKKPAPKKPPAEKKKTKAQLAAEFKAAKAAATKAAKEATELKLPKDEEEKDDISSAVKVIGVKTNGEAVNKRKRKPETPLSANGTAKDNEEDDKDCSITLSQASSSTLTSTAPQPKKQKMAPNEKPAKNPVSNFKGRQGSPESGGRISKTPIPPPKLGALSTPSTSTVSQPSSAAGVRPSMPSKPANSNASPKPKAPKRDSPGSASNISPKPKPTDYVAGSKAGKTPPKHPLSPMKPKISATIGDPATSPDIMPLASPTLKKKPANGSPLKKAIKDKDTETNVTKEKKEKTGPKIIAKRATGEIPAAKKTVPKKPRAGNADEGGEA
jgi:Sgf11 (transcriptional regulation protein)